MRWASRGRCLTTEAVSAENSDLLKSVSVQNTTEIIKSDTRVATKNNNGKLKPHIQKTIIDLKESDFTESFVKGSGPGGQKINKTSNCVQLHHISTGIIVSCQETR